MNKFEFKLIINNKLKNSNKPHKNLNKEYSESHFYYNNDIIRLHRVLYRELKFVA